MKSVDRRGLIRLAAWLGALPLFQAQANDKLNYSQLKKETPMAALYHCDYGSADRFAQTLTNMSNHLSVYDNDPFKLKLVMVVHGQGVKFFLKDLEGLPQAWTAEKFDQEAVFSRIKQLAALGVEYYICQITFTRNNIAESKLRSDDFIKWVPSGVGAVAELQARGYAYIKAG